MSWHHPYNVHVLFDHWHDENVVHKRCLPSCLSNAYVPRQALLEKEVNSLRLFIVVASLGCILCLFPSLENMLGYHL